MNRKFFALILPVRVRLLSKGKQASLFTSLHKLSTLQIQTCVVNGKNFYDVINSVIALGGCL